MTKTDLIAALASLPDNAIVRVFSVEAQDWMPITDIDHTLVIGLSTEERIDLRAYPRNDES
jgi:hypothetical protein